MDMRENKAVVKKVNDAFAENNMEKVLSYFADDVRWTMVGKKPWSGKENIRKAMKEMDMGGGSAPVFTIDAMIAEGDRVVCHGDMKMEMQDGTQWTGSFCDMYRISDGKVTELMPL